MTGDGRNIYNLAGNPDAVEGEDFDYFCPVALDSLGRINKNEVFVVIFKGRYILSSKKCF